MPKLLKTFEVMRDEAMKKWEILTKVTVDRGKTVWPNSSRDQQRIGARLDYDGVVTRDNTQYHKLQVQPNAGKIPTPLEEWRKKNGGTHAVLSTIYVKKDGTQEETRDALTKGLSEIRLG